MSQTVTISDELYERLQHAARRRGLENVEELLAQWQAWDETLAERDAAVHRVLRVRENLRSHYGEFPDSTAVLRDDRDR